MRKLEYEALLEELDGKAKLSPAERKIKEEVVGWLDAHGRQ